ncbi:MAG: hypothetical protein ER33_09650 [Cyanobium sp. CACIAM 14]|nr:MAG: hypothetical protein ER33_09650 [Cyanobium sp. CACIAM 14]
MSVSVAAATPCGGLLLVGLGQRPELAVLPTIAARLAKGLNLSLRQVSDSDDPYVALTGLASDDAPAPSGGGPGWLAALPLDPGVPLARGGRWVEALGAWRQACLLVVSEEQMATGLPAAGAALLEKDRVPLAGLLQVGGDWRPLERRRDGLAWLGWLPHSPRADDVALEAVTTVLRCRWRQLQAA